MLFHRPQNQNRLPVQPVVVRHKEEEEEEEEEEEVREKKEVRRNVSLFTIATS